MEDTVDAVESVTNRVQPVWEQVIEDVAATAEAYREEGWEAIECHPGDVAALGEADVQREDAPTGLDVLLPDDEFDRVAAAIDDSGVFDEVEVYRATQDGIVFLTAALQNERTETVVLVPAYYDRQQSAAFLETVRESGCLDIHVRPLDQRRVVTFTQQDPSPFLPADS
jgi:hypothetical protein